MRSEQRYERFEPITVRTAARVLQLQRAGVVSAREAAFYLRELLAMDAHADAEAFSALVRAAQLRAAPCRLSRQGQALQAGGALMHLV
jgi:hypothetical protein